MQGLSLDPGGEFVDEVLVFAPARHRILPVTVKNLSREYISIFPFGGTFFCIPPSRTTPLMMMWSPANDGEISV
jgi:hypothetical protein